MRYIEKLTGWYFSKGALPYWYILLLDWRLDAHGTFLAACVWHNLLFTRFPVQLPCVPHLSGHSKVFVIHRFSQDIISHFHRLCAVICIRSDCLQFWSQSRCASVTRRRNDTVDICHLHHAYMDCAHRRSNRRNSETISRWSTRSCRPE